MPNARFNEFIHFDKRFKNKYGRVAQNYPHVFSLLEHELRLMESDGEDKKRIRKLAKKSPKIVKEILRMGYYRLGCAIPDIFHLVRNQKEPKYVLKIPKFAHLHDDISHILERPSKSGELSPREARFETYIGMINGSGIVGKTFEIINRSGWNELLRNEELLESLNSEAGLVIQRVARRLIDDNVKLVISEGDYRAKHRVLVESCKIAGVVYIVICHGYIQDPELKSIAPINADGLIVWTENQKLALINSGIPEEKIIYAGNPHAGILKPPVERGRILICWHPVGAIKPMNEEMHDINEILTKIHGDKEIYFRPHPKDYGRKHLDETLKKMGINVSKSDFYDDLEAARAVIGSTSSTLFQAASNGRVAIQVAGYSSFDIEGAAVMRASEISLQDTIPEKRHSLAMGPPFDVNILVRHIEGLRS